MLRLHPAASDPPYRQTSAISAGMVDENGNANTGLFCLPPSAFQSPLATHHTQRAELDCTTHHSQQAEVARTAHHSERGELARMTHPASRAPTRRRVAMDGS